jgi:DNA (cytosine-5)-methyltransferase 1
MKLRFATVASGISAETYAWKPLGWQPVWYSEIEPFANAVLAHHYPDVPNLGDMNFLHEKKEYNESTFDVFAGGTPCQGFSLAGKRGGMDDPRSRLAFRFLDIAKQKRPRWVVWENVPDVLSSAGGRDFAAFISGMEACGYGVAWRVLDAQYFGLAQRRRRVFVVGHIGDWRPAAAVLFDRASLQGHPAPSRKKRESITYETANCLRGSGVGGERVGDSRGADPLVAVAGTLVSGGKSAGSVTNQDIDQGMLIPEVSITLLANGHRIDLESGSLIVYDLTQITSPVNGSKGSAETCHALARNQHPAIVAPELASTLTAHQHRSGGATAGNNPGIVNAVCSHSRVRRLTPVEYERLQGFPDNYTLVPYRNRPAALCADGPRYRAVGNSIPTTILKWIGQRIEMVERIKSRI